MWKQLLTFILLVQMQVVMAQQIAEGPKKGYAIYSLEDDWKVYSAKWEGLIPFTPKRHQGQKQFFLSIPSSFNSDDYIEIQLPRETDVFVGDVLLYASADSAEVWQKRIGDLRKEQETDLLLVIHSHRFLAQPPKAEILSSRLHSDVFQESHQEDVFPHTRPDDTLHQFVTLICISFFIILTFLYRSVGLRFDMETYAHFTDLVTFRRIKQHGYSGIAIALFFVGYLITSTVLLLTISSEGNNSGILWVDSLFWEPNFWIRALGFLLLLSGIEFIRLSAMWILSKVIGEKQLQVVHLLEYVELTKIYMTVVLLGFAFVLFNPFAESKQFLMYLVVISLLLKTIFVTFSVYRQLPLQKNYLFSYFCGAEFLPTLLVVKIFIQF